MKFVDLGDVFREKGLPVEENVRVVGESGIGHLFRYLLSFGKRKIVVEMSSGANLEHDLLGLFLKCIDTGIRDAIIVLEKDVEVGDRIYRIAEEAGIKIIYASDIESISF